jgi:hypothetical protein
MIFKIISELIYLIRDIYLFARFYNKRVKLKSIKENSIVIGNGPSFYSFLEINRGLISEYELFACNGFVTTTEFSLLKPENYCLLDPLYFDFNNEFVINRDNNVVKTWEELINKTTWHMCLYVSTLDLNKLKSVELMVNKNSFIRLINLFPIKFKSRFKNYFYSKGIGLIGGMTVTHLSMHLSILKLNKNILLVGVDHDWFKNYNYEIDTNEVSLLNTHFYGAEKLIFGQGILTDKNLIHEFESLYKSMLGFYELNVFSTYQNLKVYRASKSYLHFLPYVTLSKS